MRKKIILSLVLILILHSFPQSLNGQSLRGRVTDNNGDPLAGASVAIAGTFTGVRTGADGMYNLTGLKGGEYSVRFSFIGYETRIPLLIQMCPGISLKNAIQRRTCLIF